MYRYFILFVCCIISATTTNAQSTLFKNVSIFDGTSDKLITGKDVLVHNNLIHKIDENIAEADTMTAIDGGGRTLMPGIIEGHGHISLPIHIDKVIGESDMLYIGAAAADYAAYFIEHGWTTVRDVGGPAYGIKRAIDEGLIVGPRIYNSGMYISQTSGHGDFRRFYDPHPDDLACLPDFNRHYSHIADGVPEVLQAAREELRKGSVHLKLMAGGGVSSQFDPLHTTQYTLEELKAAVQAAADWGTYVLVHAYTDEAVQRSIEAGVKVIEHGQLITEETAKLMADKGIWLSTQVHFSDVSPETEKFMKENFSKATYEKWLLVKEGTETSINFAKKHDVKIAFGTDAFGDTKDKMNNEWKARQPYFSNFEILRQATSINGELLKLTGPLNPYPKADLGVIEESAYADIILVDGDPLEDVTILADQDNVHLVMKDGKIYKNTLK